MNDFFKVRQHLGLRGRPKDVEIHGATKKENEPTILGAKAITSKEPTILDRGMRVSQGVGVTVEPEKSRPTGGGSIPPPTKG